jgi:DNA invertase Pin-like site-specific DNA recombinase
MRKGVGQTVKAIVYYVILQNQKRDDKRASQLNFFLEKHPFDVVYTYYDVYTKDIDNKRIGLNNLINDLASKSVEADAFICMSAKDMGSQKKLITILTEINAHVPNIYFTDIESSSYNISD